MDSITDLGAVAQPWLDLVTSGGGIFGAVLVILCFIAVKYGYRISFSFKNGFHFGPAPKGTEGDHSGTP